MHGYCCCMLRCTYHDVTGCDTYVTTGLVLCDTTPHQSWGTPYTVPVVIRLPHGTSWLAVTSHHTIPYRIAPYHIISYHSTSCHIIHLLLVLPIQSTAHERYAVSPINYYEVLNKKLKAIIDTSRYMIALYGNGVIILLDSRISVSRPARRYYVITGSFAYLQLLTATVIIKRPAQ